MTIQRNSGFRYTTPGSSEIEHSAHLWLRRGSVGRVQTRYRNFGLDQRTYDVITLEGGAEEAEGEIRFDGDPAGLLDMLEHGANGVVLDYYPDLSASTFYPFVVIDIGDLVAIDPDEDRHGFGEWMRRVRLRRVDGGSIEDLYT